VYQIGDVHARSCVIIGTFGSILTLKYAALDALRFDPIQREDRSRGADDDPGARGEFADLVRADAKSR